MINAVIYRNKVGVVCGFMISGHAAYSEHGSDIVCSAVSVLVINTINAIDNFTDEKMNVESDEKNGIIDCVFPRRFLGECNKEADLLLKTMIAGLYSVEEQYGKFIRITEEHKNDKN